MKRFSTIAFFTSILSGCTFVAASLAFPAPQVREDRAKDLQALHHEVPDDPFIAVDRANMPVSPAFRLSTTGFFAVQVNVDDSSHNIIGDAANEPSIAVDPTNPDRMAIGWRQFNTVSNNFRQAGFAYTTDAGATWTFPGVINPGIFRSDPVLDVDAQGNFYYNSLTTSGPDYLCTVYKSSNGGNTWDNGVFAQGGDKQWMTIDKTSGAGEGQIYAFWTYAYSICDPDFFTRSVDRGASFEACVSIPDEPFWGTLAVGINDELYVCGVGDTSFTVVKSTNAMDSSQTVTWNNPVPVSLGGEVVSFAGSSSPNPGGLHGQTWIVVDHSSGPTRGNVYLLCSVEPSVGSDPLDVMFARSTDAGLTWSAPVRVNDDASTSAWQWFGTMSVAPNGRIDVVWLDTRDNPGSVNSSLYYSYSNDAGATWAENVRLSDAFDPHVGWPQQNKMGDYFHMVSDNDGASLAWAGTFNGEQDVYYGRITTALTGTGTPRVAVPSTFALGQNYPNPFNPATHIPFSLQTNGYVSLKVFDVLGREVGTLVDEVRQAGSYDVPFDASKLASGVYLYRLESGASVQTKKLVVLK